MGQDPDGDEIPGQAGIDYPMLKSIPVTAFRCTPSMANMMFADPDTACQVSHDTLTAGQVSFYICLLKVGTVHPSQVLCRYGRASPLVSSPPALREAIKKTSI